MLIGVGVSCRLLVIYLHFVADELPRLGKREPSFLLCCTCNYVVSVWRDSSFLGA